MGVDVATWRARIGLFRNVRCGNEKQRSWRENCKVVLHIQIPIYDMNVKVLLIALVVTPLALMLILSGDVEPNPGEAKPGGDSSGPPQLKDLVRLKVPPKKWYTLGLQLDITEYDLDVIKENNPNDVKACIREMFKKWLQSTSNPSYAGLSEALYRIEENSLAAEVLELWPDAKAQCPNKCSDVAIKQKDLIEVEHEPHSGEIQPTVVPQEKLSEQCNEKHEQIVVMGKFLQCFENGELWYSDGFYTHIGGYKLCLEVNAAGSGRWAGKYISIGLHLMKGNFDDILSFPFKGQITVQLENRDNQITKVFIFDDKITKAGARADQDMNKESCDIHNFVTVEDINQKFLRCNSISFRVVMKEINEGENEKVVGGEEKEPFRGANERSMKVQDSQENHTVYNPSSLRITWTEYLVNIILFFLLILLGKGKYWVTCGKKVHVPLNVLVVIGLLVLLYCIIFMLI